MTKLISLLAIPVVATLISGCATTPAESGASNIRGIKEFTLEPVKVENIIVDDLKEDDFKSKKDANQIRAWQEDLGAIKSRFANSLTETAAHAGLKISDSAAGRHYTIRPIVTKIDTGYYRIPTWNAVTRIYMHISVLDPEGKTVDETDAKGSKTFELYAADSGGRLRDSATEVGEKYGRYLEKRTRP